MILVRNKEGEVKYKFKVDICIFGDYLINIYLGIRKKIMGIIKLYILYDFCFL